MSDWTARECVEYIHATSSSTSGIGMVLAEKMAAHLETALAAINDIARQHLPEEMDPDGGDFEAGYVGCVTRARLARKLLDGK